MNSDPHPPHPAESTEPGSGSPRDGGAQNAAGRFAENLPPRYGDTEKERPLGRGGIGEVVVARELRLMREVALKRLRSDRASTAAEIRLAREARVTGLLEHPGIIPVHDIDRDDQGRLFYTMKQVGGRTLRELIEKLKPADPGATPEEQADRTEVEKRFGSIAARLEVFLKVCDALSFAHAHPLRVIHRDLKPENIMVGDFGEVMVMDWGLAKVLGKGETAESLRGTLVEEEEEVAVTDHTATLAGQFLGTPAYAPPEQLDGRVEEIDEKSDVYALGGILYHLLSLEAPLTGDEPDPSSSPAPESGNEIAIEDQPVSIPDRTETASAFEGTQSHIDSTELVRQWCLRQIQSRATARRLRGRPEDARRAGIPDPLAAVILKALEPVPEERIGSVADLARQVRFYQEGFAGDYEEAGAWRHFAYFVRRHKAASLTAAAALALIAALSAGFTFRVLKEKQAKEAQLAETLREKNRADAETARADERAAIAEAVADFLRNDILLQAGGSGQANAGFAPNPDLTIREALDRAAEKVGESLGRDPLLEAEIRKTLGSSYVDVGMPGSAIPQFKRALEIFNSKRGRSHPESLLCNLSLIDAIAMEGGTKEAISKIEELREMLADKFGTDADETLRATRILADTYIESSQANAALPLCLEVLPPLKKKLGENHPTTLSATHDLARSLAQLHRIDEALPLFELVFTQRNEVFGPEHPLTNLSREFLGLALNEIGKPNEAEPVLEKALDIAVRIHGEEHPRTLRVLRAIARVKDQSGRLDEAIDHYREVLRLRQRVRGLTNPDTFDSMIELGSCLRRQGQLDGSIEVLEEARSLAKENLDSRSPTVPKVIRELGRAHFQRREFSNSTPLFEEALQSFEAIYGKSHPETIHTLANLGTSYCESGQLDYGVDALDEAWRRIEAAPEIDATRFVWIRQTRDQWRKKRKAEVPSGSTITVPP